MMPRTRRSSLKSRPSRAICAADLLEQRAAHETGTDQPDRHRVGRQVEPGMDRPERPARLALVDHHRDVALGGSLRNRADVHADAGERREHFRGHARRSRHAVANHRQDAAAGGDVHVLQLTLFELAAEGVTHDGRRPLGFRLRDRETDRMLGARLRDQHDRHAVLAQGAEQTLRGARHANHPGAFHVHQRETVDAGNALDRMIGRRAGANQRPLALRRERVPDPDRDLFHDRRRHRLRMDHLRAEVGELHRLLVRERVDDRRVGNQSGVGAQHAIDVGPDVISSASSRLPMIDAVKSLPFRPSVV